VKRTTWYGVIAVALAFWTQALWETSFRSYAKYLVFPGTWIASHLFGPVPPNEFSSWQFGLTAIVINAVIYFLVIWSVEKFLANRSTKT